MDIQEGSLRHLEHSDGETTFVREGSKLLKPRNMSNHQVKGLEFDYVFILGLNDYQQLNVPNMDKVIYTVVTRAQKRVYIAYCQQLPDILKGVDQDLYLRC